MFKELSNNKILKLHDCNDSRKLKITNLQDYKFTVPQPGDWKIARLQI